MSQQRLKAALAALILVLCFGCGAARAQGGAVRAGDDLADLVLSLPEGIATEEDGTVRLVVRGTMKIGIGVSSGHSVIFASSDRKVAVVGRSGLVTGLKNGRAVISVTAKDSKGVARAKRFLAVRVYTPLAKLTLPSEALVLTGQKKKLTAGFSPSTASDKALAWRSENESVAAVAQDGTVTAVAPGTAAIIATSGSGRNASCAVRVADPATAVEVAAPTGEEYLHLKKRLQLRAAVRPETAFEGVTWRSGNTKVATVDANGRAYGRKVGAVTVYAIAKDGTGVKGAIRLRVITPVASVKLAPAEKVFIGRSKKLAVKRSPSKPSVKALAWRSSDERVAEVSADGTVTGRALGQAVITATATDGSGKSASCVLTVARPVEEISVSPENGYALVYKGEKVRLVAGVAPEDANDKSLKWSSSNKACAVVDGRGVVAGIRPGKVKITARAKDGSGTAQSVSLVVGLREKAIKLNKRDAVIYINGASDALRSVRLSAKALPSGASYRGLRWELHGTSVTVDAETGLVTAVREGSSTVQAVTENRCFDTCLVTVLRLPEVLSIRTEAVTLAFGQRYDLGADVVTDEACTEKALTWASSNTKVAAVTKDGVVKAAKSRTGTATIRAQSKNGHSVMCVITVVKALPKRDTKEAPEVVQETATPPEDEAWLEEEAAQGTAATPEEAILPGDEIEREPGIVPEEAACPEEAAAQGSAIQPEETAWPAGEAASMDITKAYPEGA